MSDERRELTALRAAFERTSGGRSELVLLVGELGAGKTRLAEHWAEECAASAQVWWARCYEHQGTPPFWLWVQPLRAYLRQLEDTRLAKVVGDAAPVLINLIPELASRLAPVQPAPRMEDTAGARFRLYDAVAGVIERASHDQPLVIILDNLHGADTSSLLLLEYVARELRSSPLLIIGTYRDVGAAQFENRNGDKAYNLSRIRELTAGAAALGARVVSFHEGSISGYTFARRLDREALSALAEPVPDGPSTQELIDIAREHEVTVLAGLFERDRDRLYNTYVCAGADGVVARHLKLHVFGLPIVP